MKAVFALTLANAILAAATPLQERAYVTHLDVKTVTNYVYPDGSPATVAGAQPTPAVSQGSVKKPASDSSSSPSSSSGSSAEQPAKSDSSGSASSSGGVDMSSFSQASVTSHNAHRSNHTCSGVSWNQTLADAAKQLADTCSYKHDT